VSKLEPICAKCKRTMVCAKNNFLVADPASGDFPSTYWYGDKWDCPGCGAEIVVGFGGPLARPTLDPNEQPLVFDYKGREA
jgi:hypothetical protein